MQFNKTETYLNLARSFAGESQAGMRYQYQNERLFYPLLCSIGKPRSGEWSGTVPGG